MHVSLCNLQRLHTPLRERIDAAIGRVIDSGRFIGGDEVTRFERRFAARVGSEYAVAVSSGTDALLASLMALDLQPGDEVITTPFTFAAPAQAIARLGAIPVFVDIDPTTFNIDATKLEAAIGPRTVGILPVHLFGQTADLAAIDAIAVTHRLWIVEDAAQGIGALHRGRHAGTHGEFGCFSFFPTKTLGAMGDGGLIVTNAEDRAADLRRVRHHGAGPKYVHHRLGGNFRLDALQAAVLDVKLHALDPWLDARAQNAAYYTSRLPAEVAPSVAEGCHHAWHQYVVRCPSRDAVRAKLESAGIETAIYYPGTLDQQRCFGERFRVAGTLPEAHRAANQTFAIPVGPELTDEERTYVADTLLEALEGLV